MLCNAPLSLHAGAKKERERESELEGQGRKGFVPPVIALHLFPGGRGRESVVGRGGGWGMLCTLG